MNIGILAVDSNFPNLALMKISAYHKARGDQVEMCIRDSYYPLSDHNEDMAMKFMAKAYSFTDEEKEYILQN